jgi:acetyltransferase-like isoleucine patch superfamily enzyme
LIFLTSSNGKQEYAFLFGTTIFPPFYTDFGRFIQIGKNAFINHACSRLEMGGITIEDEVLIGLKVNLIEDSTVVERVDTAGVK